MEEPRGVEFEYRGRRHAAILKPVEPEFDAGLRRMAGALDDVLVGDEQQRRHHETGAEA